MKKIAVYALSRNHAEFVDRWVKSVKAADGIFVLDLGSQDNTVAKLKRRGVAVGVYKGESVRYDSARNQALEMVPQDYDICLACELNDSLPADWKIRIMSKMIMNFDLMSYIQRNHFNNQFVSDVNKKWIHKRNINFKWQNPVEETFKPVCRSMAYKVIHSNMIVNHHEKRAKKKSDYFDWLKTGYEENTGDESIIHYLAIEYMRRNQFEDAMRLFLQHIEKSSRNTERAESMRYIAAMTTGSREKIQWLYKTITEDPLRKEHWLDLAIAYYKIQDWEKVINACLVLSKIGDKTDYITYAPVRSTIANELCAYAAYQLKMYKLAYLQGKMALKKNSNDKILMRNMVFYKKVYQRRNNHSRMQVGNETDSRPLPENPRLYAQPHSKNYIKLLKRGGEQLYCIIPFCHMILAPNGVKCCTWLTEREGVNYVSLEENRNLSEIWQDKALQRVRDSIRDGSYTECQLAYCPEIRGARSHLLSLKEIKEKFPGIADFLEGRTNSYSMEPVFVNISNDLTCNLKCPSCSRHLLPDFNCNTKSHFLNALKVFGKSLKTIFLAGMGEPFFSPVYLNWIRQFRSEDFPALEGITINTNGQLFTDILWKGLPVEFTNKVNIVIVSIDGATAATYEKNRRGGTFKTLMKNLSFLRQLRSGGQISILKLYFVYQLNNYKEIPEMIKIAEQFLFDNVFFARISNWGGFSSRLYRRLDVGNPGHIRYGALKRIRNQVEDFRKENSRPVITFMM